MKAHYREYKDFLDHVIIVADRHKISVSESVQCILGDEFQVLVNVFEQSGTNMAKIQEDVQKTYIYKSNEEFYKANGIDRNWLGIDRIQE